MLEYESYVCRNNIKYLNGTNKKALKCCFKEPLQCTFYNNYQNCIFPLLNDTIKQNYKINIFHLFFAISLLEFKWKHDTGSKIFLMTSIKSHIYVLRMYICQYCYD